MPLDVHIDMEVFSEANLPSVGAYCYAQHPTTEVICMAYAVDGDEVQLWTPGQPVPGFIRSPAGFTFHAHNSFFEYVVWAYATDWGEPPPLHQWVDTAAQAAALALPRALGQLAAALGLPQDQQKDKRGRDLIRRVCMPYKGQRNNDPFLLEELYDYCKQDVVAERACAKLMLPLRGKETSVWELDQRINLRGINTDAGAVDDALAILADVTTALNDELTELTKGEVTSATQIGTLLTWVNEQGVEADALNKAALRELLASDLPAHVRRALEIRQSLGKTSTAKYAALQGVTADDGRAHGLLMYHGAATGRWTGKHFQPQNLTKATFTDVGNCIKALSSRDHELLNALWGDAMEALSGCIRGMLIPSDGCRFLAADYSAIEARVLPWLADEADTLKVFEGAGRIYEHTAAKIYNVAESDVDKEQRFIGKVATLALGYQGGAKAFTKMADNYGVQISEALAEDIKVKWRKANPNVVELWNACERAALDAVREPGMSVDAGPAAYKQVGAFLFCKLPSGRLLSYPAPAIREGKFGNDELSFMKVNSVTRKWERCGTYGGDLVQSITQATARDIMAEAMLRVESAGYRVVLTVHDEIVAERKHGAGSIDEFITLLCELPCWAGGLPLTADGFECARYRK